MVDRQITRRMTALILGLLPRRSHYHRGKPADPGTFLERYRARLSALTTKRQPEIDALSRNLALQEQAIATLIERHGHEAGLSEQVPSRMRSGRKSPRVDGPLD
jgi:hypothetical protein